MIWISLSCACCGDLHWHHQRQDFLPDRYHRKLQMSEHRRSAILSSCATSSGRVPIQWLIFIYTSLLMSLYSKTLTQPCLRWTWTIATLSSRVETLCCWSIQDSFHQCIRAVILHILPCTLALRKGQINRIISRKVWPHLAMLLKMQ